MPEGQDDDLALCLRHLAGELHGPAGEAFSIRLAHDAGLRRRLREAACLDTLLPIAMAAPPERNRLRVPLLALAAGLLIALGLALWPWPDRPRLRVAGALGGPAAWTAPADAEATVVCEDPALRAAFAPGSAFRLLADPPAAAIALERGRMEASVQPMRPGESWRIELPHGSLSIRGTSFAAIAGEHSSTLVVREGLVAVRMAHAAADVGAGQELLLHPGLPALPLPAGRPLGPATAGSGWMALGSPGCRPAAEPCDTPAGPGVRLAFADGLADAVGWAAATRHWAGHGLDLSTGTALRCWFLGRGDGRTITIELSGPPPAGDLERSERFVQTFIDDHAGWGVRRLPLNGFVRRSDWQPDHAPHAGFDPRSVHAITVILAPGRAGSLTWSDWVLE